MTETKEPYITATTETFGEGRHHTVEIEFPRGCHWDFGADGRDTLRLIIYDATTIHGSLSAEAGFAEAQETHDEELAAATRRPERG